MSSRALSAEERVTFELIARATFANPFKRERYTYDAELLGMSLERTLPEHPDRARVTEALHAYIHNALQQLSDGVTLRDYTGRDQQLVTYAVLFESFFRFEPRLTAHALAQLEAGEALLEVDFAREALGHLRRWGFDREQSARFFGLLYQLSRAYLFIQSSLPGESTSMRTLRARLWQNVFTDDLELYEFHLWSRMEDFSTFLLGETGTGKGTAARALGLSGWIPYHEHERRFAKALSDLFIPVNLSQYTETLIESELFGHRKGAFTGAIKDHEGVFKRCLKHGTIFLDELGEVSEPIQIKLLNVLQERAFTPVGSHKAQRFEGRVIAATNQPIDALRASGAFRDDFFYRLCSDILVMPTLRQRIQEDPAELDLLLTHIVTRVVGAPMRHLVERVQGVIQAQLGPAYPWHGNVRELEQCVRRVLMSGTYDPGASQPPRSDAARIARQVDRGELTAAQLTAEYCWLLYQRLGTYEGVGEVVQLDRRTVKKYIDAHTD